MDRENAIKTYAIHFVQVQKPCEHLINPIKYFHFVKTEVKGVVARYVTVTLQKKKTLVETSFSEFS